MPAERDGDAALGDGGRLCIATSALLPFTTRHERMQQRNTVTLSVRLPTFKGRRHL